MRTENALRTAVALGLVAGVISAAGGAEASWPAYRGNNTRTGCTPQDLPRRLHLQWTHVAAHPPRPAWPEPGKEVHRMTFDYAFHVTAADGRLFYGSSADHKVYALDPATGKVQWTFFTEGPVRFAPCVSGGRVYVAGDDGCLYCLGADDGRLIWQFRGGPRDERLVGNGQVISRWPARSGALVDGKTVYFTAGMWSTDGITVYALNADNGSVIWKNNTSNMQYMLMPHNNYEGISGVSPQGYLALADGVLLVPTGRAIPARYDAATGKMLPWSIAWGKHHRPGSSWTMSVEGVFFSARRGVTGLPTASLGPNSRLRPEGLMAWNVRTGKPAFAIHDVYTATFADKTLYMTSGTYSGTGGSVIAVDYGKISKKVVVIPPHTRGHDGAGSPAQKLTGKAKWQTPTGRIYELISAGKVLVAGGENAVLLLDSGSGKELWKAKVDGQARGLAVASGRLLVSTSTGRIYCFGSKRVDDPPVVKPRPGDRARTAKGGQVDGILNKGGVRAGYCLVLGLNDPQLPAALAQQSKLTVVVVEADEKKIARARRLVDRLGLYGTRIAVHRGSPDTLPYAPYFANLIVARKGAYDAKAARRCLRPCGGVMAVISGDGPRDVALTRRGPLDGSDEWSHPFANAGRTSASRDRRVRLPMKVLWFGGPGPARMVDRHRYPPIPVYANGRLYVPAENFVIALDAYNGREMWARELKGVGRFPGNDRGASVVADRTGVYAPHGTTCVRLDGDTGEILRTYKPPVKVQPAPKAAPAGPPSRKRRRKTTKGGYVFNAVEWNYLAVTDKAVLGTIGEARVRKSWANWPLSTPNGKVLFALDKDSGKTLWVFRPEYGAAPKGIVVGSGRVCLLDQEIAPGKIGRTRLKALDVGSGKLAWSKPLQNRWELLLSDGLLVAAGTGYSVFDVKTGAERWSNTVPPGSFNAYGAGADHYQWSVALRDFPVIPPMIVNGTIVAPPRAFDLATGKETHRAHPLSGGTIWPFGMGNGGCGTYSACPALMFMRSGSLGMYDIASDTGMHWLGQVRPSCWINTLPAGGILMMPEGASSCTCAYSFQTSVALVADDRHEEWGAYTCEPPRPGSRLRTAKLNFGAVGDKRDADGKLWLGFPRPFSPQNLKVPLTTSPDAEYTRLNADEVAITPAGRPWLYSTGVKGLTAATLELDLVRPAVAVKAATAPTVDGKLDEPCWDGSREIVLVDDSRRESSARAWLRHDGKTLYIGFRRKAPLVGGKPVAWTMNTRGENAPAWRDDCLKVRLQKGGQYEYIFLSASGARTTGRSDRRWKMKGTAKKTAWRSATHASPAAWSAEIAVPIDAPGEGMKIFLESFNRTGVGPERTFYRFRSWRRWFVSGGEANVVFTAPPAPPERTFTVHLHFAELEDVTPGRRVFDVRIQGRTVIRNLDVVAAAGGPGKALVREVKGVKAAEEITLALVPSKTGTLPAILSAVEIEPE